ncbi:MAG: methylcrotonoyl-CoA carboxylase [Gammaproteobacteria bacterium]|nr:methylcrotonoyl-CoA carboxylase [Gammaproteobacteria bacterium]
MSIHRQLAEQLHQRLSAAQSGNAQSVARHRKRGKLLPRERIAVLLDDGSPFLELSPLAAYGVYDDDIPAAGIVCGIGLVHGRPVMVMANDATVKGGSYYPLTGKKHLRAQEVAEQNRLPCIYLVDSGGANLPMQDQIFPDKDHFGRIFFNQANMSAAGIAQIAVVLGSCTAGGAYLPAMADESVIVEGNGTIFLAGPPLVEAATGEQIDAQSLGGGRVHATLSGVVDHRAPDDQSALAKTRQILAYTNSRALRQPEAEPEANPQPRERVFEFLPESAKTPYDCREIIRWLVDGERFEEFKAEHGTTLVCAFAAIEGYRVGILGNNGVLHGDSARKAAHFVQLCEQRRIPLLFLQNITGFMVGSDAEHSGIARDGAKMVHAVSRASVPKLTLIVGGSYGAGNYGMCGRAFNPRLMFSWPNSRIAVMGGEQAANTLATVQQTAATAKGSPLSDAQMQAIRQPVIDQFETQADPYYATARLWDDGIIDPRDTRRVLAMALAACDLDPNPAPPGVYRM